MQKPSPILHGSRMQMQKYLHSVRQQVGLYLSKQLRVRNANANSCFPITEAPSKSPTISPTKTSSASPSKSTTTEEDACDDDETATFALIKIDKDFPCSWINNNYKKRAIRKEKYCALDIRKEKYCALDDVKAICPVSCGLCSK